MVSESDSKFLKFAEWFIWFLLGVTIVIGIWIGIYSDAEFADKLGSFLSGAFSPLAFLFVMLGYLKQVQSQKDTEDFLKKQSNTMTEQATALKQQSKALADQLKITTQQFQYYLQEIESKKPLYILVDNKPNKVNLFPTNNGHYDFFSCSFIIKNIQAGGEITSIEMYYINENQSTKLEVEFTIQSNKINTQVKATSNLKIDTFQYARENYGFEESSMPSYKANQYENEIALNYLKHCKLKIFYRLTQEAGSGNDEYIIKFRNNDFVMQKLIERNLTYSLQWENENGHSGNN